MTEDPSNPRPDLKPYVGKKLTVIAWICARTVKSPNPAFSHVDVPLASTFMLSTKPGKEAYVEILGARASRPQEGDEERAGETPALPGYRFVVKLGHPKDLEQPKNGTKLTRGANFRCLMSGVPIAPEHIYSEANAGRMGARLMAIVAEGLRGRVYLTPTLEDEAAARQAKPAWKPGVAMPENPRWFSPPLYGLKTYGDLFTPRQLVALTTISDLVTEAREQVMADCLGARASRPRRAWHSRGYLPHYEAGEHPQSISFRLFDSLPHALVEGWQAEIEHLPEAQRDSERRKRIDAYLDASHGACWLRQEPIAQLVANALAYFDGERYRLHAWCLTPNHVHVLVTPLHGNSLSSILHTWKSFTAKAANKALVRQGPFWEEEYFDRAIRNDEHFATAWAYIEGNPVKAGLCRVPEDWPWSSAGDEERAGRPHSQELVPLDEGGSGARAYAEAVGTYLGIAVDKLTDYNSSLVAWSPTRDQLKTTFARQALPMVWDYSETNPFAGAAGDLAISVQGISRSMFGFASSGNGFASQSNAQEQAISENKVVSTDPPYYDNIGYADLSDFFYVWLRRSLKPIFPDLFATLAVPKAEELVATPYRHGSKDKAESFFLDGMTQAMHRLAEQAHPAFPVTIYYAFKQSETLGARASRPQDGEDEPAGETPALPGVVNSGWETFLAAVMRAGFAVTGTWPMRTERGARSISIGTNALASSIILVCRKRDPQAPSLSRRDFQRELRDEMPQALETMIGGKLGASPIAPVDLAQAAIGPGMAIYSKYAAVLEADGTPMSVDNALVMINKAVEDFLNPNGAGLDADTLFCSAWFDQWGWATGKFGEADIPARAKGTCVDGVAQAGVVESGGGKVRLLRWDEYPRVWDPTDGNRTPVWEACHQLIRALNQEGESATGALLAGMPERGDQIRQLAYHLYTLCERKKWADDARAYNELIAAWHGIVTASHETGQLGSQGDLDL